MSDQAPDAIARPLGDQIGGLPATVGAREPKRSLRERWLNRDTLAAYLFLAPALIHFAIFFLGLVLISFGLSFMSWDLFSPPKFVGLANYKRLLFEDPDFWPTFWRTAYYVALVIPTSVAAELALALAVNTRLRAIKFFRATYFIPVVASAVAVALVWGWILNTQNGILNWFLSFFALGPFDWLGSPRLAMPSVALVQVWRGLGEGMIIFLAGLQAIPQHLYEAAELDGAGRWAKFWNVTWPLLSPTTFFVTVLEVIGSFQVFDMIYLLTHGGPARATTVYNFELYQEAFINFRMGYAAAMTWLLFVVIGILTLIQFRVINRRVQYELG
jgi:multiple sugar transport system permease protein